jgi:hypothetical protein
MMPRSSHRRLLAPGLAKLLQTTNDPALLVARVALATVIFPMALRRSSAGSAGVGSLPVWPPSAACFRSITGQLGASKATTSTLPDYRMR